MFKQITGAVFLAVLMSACGGGGGDNADTTAGSNGTSSSPPVTTPPPVPPAPVGAAAIEVPDGFDFASSTTLPVTVSLSGVAPAKAYLTVCRNTPAGADYDRCLLRTPLSGGRYDGEIQVPNHVDSLTAIVWSFTPASVVRSIEWQRSGEGLDALHIQ